jgi:FG-GAP repeat protein
MKALVASIAVALLVSVPLRAEDVWNEQRAVPDEAGSNAQFGSAASLDGSLALFGADGDNSFRGAAYFYTKGDSGWTELQRITPDDTAAAEFGYRVLLRGDLAIVTADQSSPNGNTAQGSAYVFAPDNTGTWAQTQILLADDGQTFDNFGSTASMDGNTLLIGAHGATVGANAAQGAAYLFANHSGTFSQTGKVVADDGVAFDNFGITTAIAGDTLFVGAATAAIGGHNGQGAVYAYHLDNGIATQTQKLVSDDGAANDNFGLSLAFDGTTLMVGAIFSGGTGAVYVFTNDGTSWQQQQRLSIAGISQFSYFGNAIALRDGKALIGADGQNVGTDTTVGAAYLFGFDGTSWVQQHTFLASDGTTDDFFGLAVDYDGTTALISTLHPNGNQGAAYFYTHDTIFTNGFDG